MIKNNKVKKPKTLRISILRRIEYENTVKVQRRLTEVGLDGMFIDSCVTFPIGSVLKLQLWLMNSDQPLQVDGKVIREEKGIGMEVSFLNLKPKDRFVLESLADNLVATGN